LLWDEKIIRSVANLTWKDGFEFLCLAAQVPVKTDTRLFLLEEANETLAALRRGSYAKQLCW
jgi:alcohol dehydrogenase, propanol-preferring